jgi:hypothetical protein
LLVVVPAGLFAPPDAAPIPPPQPASATIDAAATSRRARLTLR